MIPKVTNRSLALELTATTVAVLVLSHALYRLRAVPFINDYISVFVAVILLYTPVIVLWLRHREIDFMERSFGVFFKSIEIFLIASIVVFPAFFFAAHFWQTLIMGYGGFRLARFPDALTATLFQIFIVALPEEFYFRGYMQSAMNLIFPRKWRFLGANIGWGLIVTAFVFAFAHSIIVYRWWHFAIFFPALVFGYLRERTGSITAPILFHAVSNILMQWFSRCYF